jgi:hypothetical protein
MKRAWYTCSMLIIRSPWIYCTRTAIVVLVCSSSTRLAAVAMRVVRGRQLRDAVRCAAVPAPFVPMSSRPGALASLTKYAKRRATELHSQRGRAHDTALARHTAPAFDRARSGTMGCLRCRAPDRRLEILTFAQPWSLGVSRPSLMRVFRMPFAQQEVYVLRCLVERRSS